MICNFYLSVTERTSVCADPSLRYKSYDAGTLSNQETTTSSLNVLVSPLGTMADDNCAHDRGRSGVVGKFNVSVTAWMMEAS